MAEAIIAAKYEELRQKAAQLRSLAGKVSGRPCTVSLSASKGAFADEMNQTVAALNEVSNALATLATATAAQIDSMCVQFNEADELASTQFSGGK